MTYHFEKNNGCSVNSLIPLENSVMKYDGIDNVIKLVKYFGQNALLSKCDIKMDSESFVYIPLIIPTCVFTWNSLYYYDRCLPIGASSSWENF